MYKPGQGIVSRMGVMVLGFLVAMYAGHSWYYWSWLYKATESLLDRAQSAGFIGAILIFVGVNAGTCYIVLFEHTVSDYLIDMDMELRKVVWPSVMPLFDPKTEAWGSTYVVIGCTVILTVFIWLVDVAFDFTITQHLLQWLV